MATVDDGDVRTFAGYAIRPSRAENTTLTHVRRGTPGGEYLRRFWHPVALQGEIGEAPLALRVLGEDLVLFRDLGGRVGLLHRRCSHRGVSLEYGLPTERGLRCCYHGWLYDADGTLLETPAEPPTSRLCSTLRHGAYPTRVHGGLVFAYLGPPEALPEFPVYDSWVHPGDNELRAFKLTYPCNWLQCHENTADPIHIPFLHGRVSGQRFSPGFHELPVVVFADTPLGMATASLRATEGRLWIRTADVIAPNVAQFPPAFETGEDRRSVLGAFATRWIVPIDDTSSWVIGFRHFNRTIDPFAQGDRRRIGLEMVDFPGQTAAPDADRQRDPGDYEAMTSQGAITIHAAEHLASSDRGVVRLRRQLATAIAEVGEGIAPREPAHAADGTIPTYTYEGILPWPAPGDRATLERVGGAVLRRLIDSAALPAAERAAAVAAVLEDRAWR